MSFADIAVKYLVQLGYEPHLCQSETEARELVHFLPNLGKWPCLFTQSDTTGEKDIEEFFTCNDELDMTRFTHLGVIKPPVDYDEPLLQMFEQEICAMKTEQAWTKTQIVALFNKMMPEFEHKETGKYLDGKM